MDGKGVVQVTQEHSSHQVVAVLAGMLEQARAGNITGMVFGLALKGGHKVFCDSAGTLYRDTLKGAGVAALLARHMLDQVELRSEDTIF